MGAMATLDQARSLSTAPQWIWLALGSCATLPADEVLARLESTVAGLSHDQARGRLARGGCQRAAQPWRAPARGAGASAAQSAADPAVAAALTSFAVGERTSALIILLIICLSVGLGFFNEYRSELAVEALHSKLRHQRAGRARWRAGGGRCHRARAGRCRAARRRRCRAGGPALAAVDGLECDEAVLTGESLAAEKRQRPVRAPESPLDLARARSWAPSCAKAAGWASSSRPAGERSSARSRCSSENGSRRPPSSSACVTSRCCSSE